MIISGPALQHAEIARLIGGLSIEISTGLKVGRGHSVMNVAKQWCGSSKQTKKGVLGDLVEWFYANGGTVGAQWGSIQRALGPDDSGKLLKRAMKAEKTYQAKQEAK